MPRSSLPDMVTFLPPDTGSLARGLPPVTPGTLFVLGHNGGVRVHPDCGMAVVFGRNEPDVHVCVGPGDTGMSRRQGMLSRSGRRGWSLTNTGQAPIRTTTNHVVLRGHDYPLPESYSPLYINTGTRREHVLEVRIAGVGEVAGPTGAHDAATGPREPWRIKDSERLVLTCLAQKYLAAHPRPQPLPWADVSAELEELYPDQKWGVSKVETIVRRVRVRLSERGVPGLTMDEVEEPIGNSLNHNLILELLLSTTLVVPDLELIS